MTQKSGDRRSDLGRVRGLGSAKEGVQHWWLQRLTAIALVPLTLWFIVSVITHLGASRAELALWLQSPLWAGLMILFLIATFWHALLGLQVVVEDYVHGEGTKLATLLIVKGLVFVLGAGSVIAVIKLMLQG